MMAKLIPIVFVNGPLRIHSYGFYIGEFVYTLNCTKQITKKYITEMCGASASPSPRTYFPILL